MSLCIAFCRLSDECIYSEVKKLHSITSKQSKKPDYEKGTVERKKYICNKIIHISGNNINCVQSQRSECILCVCLTHFHRSHQASACSHLDSSTCNSHTCSCICVYRASASGHIHSGLQTEREGISALMDRERLSYAEVKLVRGQRSRGHSCQTSPIHLGCVFEICVCLSVCLLMCVLWKQWRCLQGNDALPCSDRPATPLFDDLTGSHCQLSTYQLPACDKRCYYYLQTYHSFMSL